MGVDEAIAALLGRGVSEHRVREGVEQRHQVLLGERSGRSHVEEDEPAPRSDQPLGGKIGVVAADKDVARHSPLREALAEPADPEIHPAVLAPPQLTERRGVNRNDGDGAATRLGHGLKSSHEGSLRRQPPPDGLRSRG
jgi:hypothetical protein